MKRLLTCLTLSAWIALGWTAWTPALHAQSAQGEQIKKKAKDFKKQVEGEPSAKTNAPPKKAPPPQKPGR